MYRTAAIQENLTDPVTVLNTRDPNGVRDALKEPVSYTHLTLPTNREV